MSAGSRFAGSRFARPQIKLKQPGGKARRTAGGYGLDPAAAARASSNRPRAREPPNREPADDGPRIAEPDRGLQCVRVPAIQFDAVSFAQPTGAVIFDNLTLAVDAGEVVALVGRSGAGKTTLLRLVNRLALPQSGRVLVDGRDTREWDPIRLRRAIGYVIQDVGLFPHMTVADNIGVVPRLERWAPARIEARVGRAARARRAVAGDACRALARGAVRRAAPARRRGARARRGSRGAAHGRAVRRARSDDPRRAAAGVPRHPVPAEKDRDHRHPRHARGACRWRIASACSRRDA